MSEFNETNLLEITEMLNTATQNVETVYESGYASGYGAGYDVGYADGKNYGDYASGFDAGVQSEYDRFWDAYQENGEKENYEAAFGGPGWNNETFKPKYPLVPTYAYNMFYSCGVTDGYEYLKNADFSQCTFLNATFAQCHFKRIGTIDCSSAANAHNLFSHARELETIDKIIINKDHTLTGAFTNNIYLKDVTFEGEIGNDLVMAGEYVGNPWGVNLTKASIQNIIGHLSDDASGKTLTLSKAAVDEAFKFYMEFLPEDNAENYWIDGSEAGEWLELSCSKTNWTITLI